MRAPSPARRDLSRGRGNFSSSSHRNGAVVVAVPLMRMMQVAFDEVVGVAAVRYRLVAASRAMSVLTVVRSTSV
jgi:hypothetical protein